MMRWLEQDDGVRLAYRWRVGAGPALVFLPGYRSDMLGGKAVALDQWCESTGRALLRLDYSGHGESEGVFETGTIGRWAADARAVIEAVVPGEKILVGSSMGGWIALLLARELSGLKGLVLIAPAPDFSEELMWGGLSEAQRRTVMEQGGVHLPNPYGDPYWVSRAFIEDGRRHLLLGDAIAVRVPVRLLQGQEDASVPWQTSLRIAEKLQSRDVRISLIKDGDHRLSRAQDLALLVREIADLS
jgi:pimeloyl-ACP methyl ester carboxylesterase